jgi:nucleoside-diphosphate-sugar epimerase
VRVTVLGASGGMGRTLIDELLRRGHTVTAVSRSGAAMPDGVQRIAADLTSPADAKRACAGADVAVLAAQPPYQRWVTQWPPMMRNVIAGASATHTKLVFTDNLYAYSPVSGPISETSPEHATDHKGVVRRELGRMLQAAHEHGDLRVAIGRFSDYYGPYGTSSVVHNAGITPALRGRTPRGLFHLDHPHTFHYLPDAARGFAELIERPEADGRVWILPAAPPITQRELLTLITTETGQRQRVARVTVPMLRMAGLFNAQLRESLSVAPQYDRPWVVDATRFVETFGAIATTPHDRAIAETVAWCRTRR